MTAQWTKGTLSARILEMQTDERSMKLIPSVQLFNIKNNEFIDLDASHKQTSIVPNEYTYTIPNLSGHEIHICISNEYDKNVTVKQRCRPTHGECLTDTNLPPHSARILPLKYKVEDECTGFDIVQVDPQQKYPNNIKALLLILNFKYPEHEQEQLRKLLHKIKNSLNQTAQTTAQNKKIHSK